MRCLQIITSNLPLKTNHLKEQNYKNHSRISFSYHVLTLLPLLALLIGSIRHLVTCDAEELYNASLIVLIALILLSIFFHARGFALKAQDRAIRAEEQLRYFILTGKRMDSRLRLGQVIALRFAADEEFVALTDRAVAENMAPKEIKEAIKNWRGDHHRV